VIFEGYLMISKGIDTLYISKNVGHKSEKIPVESASLEDVFDKKMTLNGTTYNFRIYFLYYNGYNSSKSKICL